MAMKDYYINEQEYLSYSPDFLDEDIIGNILKIDSSGLSVEATEDVLKEVRMMSQMKDQQMIFSEISFKQDDNIDSVVNKVFDFMKADPEIGEKALKTKFAGDMQTNINLAAINDAVIGEKVNNYIATMKDIVMLDVKNACENDVVDDHLNKINMEASNISKTIAKGKVAYKINDEVVLEYDVSSMSKKNGKLFEIIINWAFVLVDIFSIICTAAGIFAPKFTKTIQKKIMNLLAKAWDKIKPCFSLLNKMGGASNIKDKFEKVCKFIKLLSKLGNLLWKCVKLYFSELKWWQIIIEVCLLIATVVLIFTTSGSILVKNILELGTQFDSLTRDVVKAVKATV